MAQVNLSNCSDVAKRELAYLHDIQMLQQELIRFFGGNDYFDLKVAPKLTKEVKDGSDYAEQVIL